MVGSNYILAIFFAQAKVKHRKEWDAALESVWPELMEELRKNPGFKGMVAMWNVDDSGDVSVIGLWESMEHRLGFEKRSAPRVRAIFESLMHQKPDRYRYLVTKASIE